jgi:integrase
MSCVEILETIMNRGRILTTEPLKSIEDVQKVREVVKDDPRALALFTLGCNSALRANDLLGLKRTDLVGNELLLREKKTKKLRKIVLNHHTLSAIHGYLQTRDDKHDWMFVGQRGRMTHGYFGWMCKQWFQKAGIKAHRVATHSLRKTFVRLNHTHFNVKLSTLMFALNHSSERQTLQYCGLMAEDVEKVYKNEI